MRNWTDRINQINRSYRIAQSFQGFRTDPNYPDRPELTCSLYTSSEIPTLPYPPHIRVFIKIYNNLIIYT